jgi:hypothetical protein
MLARRFEDGLRRIFHNISYANQGQPSARRIDAGRILHCLCPGVSPIDGEARTIGVIEIRGIGGDGVRPFQQ